ncbi:MAG: FAD-dependent oxidoreductase, partial [Planctomycetota bacterium]
SLAVLGAGPIGCELSQAMARLGVSVTLLADGSEDATGLLPADEPDAGRIVADALRRDGVTIRRDGRSIAVRPAGGEAGVAIDGPEGPLTAQRLLVAVGRTPNVEGLGLDAVGVEADPRDGVRVDETFRTTNPRIFAAGDVASARRFTHLADFQARTVVRNALLPWPMNRARGPALAVPWSTYTSPEVAGVGLTTAEAERRGLAYDTYRVELADVDRAILDGETEGFVQALTARGTDALVGATVVAPHAGELIGELSLAMTHGLGLGKIGAAIQPYPTVGEAIRKLGDQYQRTRLTPAARGAFRRWFAWTR